MGEYQAFPDVEPALIEDLKDFGDGFTSTPYNLKTLLAGGAAVLRIARIGGGNTKQSDEPRVSVQTFMLRDPQNPRACHGRAREIEAHLLSLPRVVTIPAEYGGGTARLDSADTESGPVEFPWPDPAIQVVQCIYRITTRR